jgi:hypothetical protein
MAVPRRVRRFINAGVTVTLDCKYAKSNVNYKGIVRSLRRVSPKLLLRPHALLTLMVHHYRRFALTSATIWPYRAPFKTLGSRARALITSIDTSLTQ